LNLLTTFYQVIYNYYANFKKYPTNPFIGSWLALSLFLDILFLNFLCIFDIISGSQTNLVFGKGRSLFLMALGFFIMYQILFNLLKIKKQPDQSAELFEISSGISKKYWTAFIINFILFFCLAILRKKLTL
jgi:hypothetical protein